METFSPRGTSGRVSPRVVAAMVAAALASGCFGYNPSAKRWAYVGDTLLVLGGGGVIAADLTANDEACMPATGVVCGYESPISGMLVTGAVLAAAGLFGMLFNATRPNVKSSR